MKVGLVTAAHLHVYGYLGALRTRPDVELVGVWDHDSARGAEFAGAQGLAVVATRDELLDRSETVVVVSENRRHAEDIEAAARAGVHALVEKPICTTPEEAARIRSAVAGSDRIYMTAFPCRVHPAWPKVKAAAERIGPVRAVMATNRGTCPYSWFVDKSESGGAAMMDHTVHVADLLLDLFGDSPDRVEAQVSHNMNGQSWEDVAMLTLDFPNGVFATIDSSWSRPKGYRVWGDVTLNLVGEGGTAEVDLFGQEIHRYSADFPSHVGLGYGSDLDRLLVAEFLEAIAEGREPLISLEAGLRSAEVAIAGYASLRP